MSLIRQLLLLLLGSLLLAFVGSVTVHVGTTRDVLQTQLNLKNSDNAAALAMVLSQQKGDAELMGLLVSAQFDTGFYQAIRLQNLDGQAIFERVAEQRPRQAPNWFVSMLPIASQPGLAQVSDGWRAIGSVRLSSQTAYAHDELWRASLWSAAALAAVGVVAALLASALVQRIRRPLDQAVLQAHALVQGEFVTVPEPRVPDMQRLTRAMNSMVSRLKLVFEAQAKQVQSLRHQAHCDGLTGLSNRKHFMAQLSGLREREDGSSEGGLVLLRVLNLAEMNRSHGHDTTDRVLLAVAQALASYQDRSSSCHAGRLNGSDFALCLPVGGLAQETAKALVEALRAVLPALCADITVVAGALEMHSERPLAQQMSAADAALASAESQGDFAVALGDDAVNTPAMLGEVAWRQAIYSALGQGRLQLVAFPVLDPANQLVHLECPLRLQLDPNGPFVSAARWLPLALRARLTAHIDERAATLALQAIAADGLPRCVNLSTASLAESAFPIRLRALLQASPQAAAQLSLELPEAAALEHFEALQELGRQLRPLGVRLGLEHAGERLERVPRLFELGLNYVKLDAAVIADVEDDAQRSLFVRSLATMLHGLGAQVMAEGVVEESHAQALWALGVDAITGAWASHRRADLLRL
ncbi:MAG: EAL domain-containing protein [Rhizobacter sp.]